MPAKDTIELRARTDEQLQQDLEAAHQALFNLRFQAATRQLADVGQIDKAKKRIARAKTLLRERAILAEVEAARNAATKSE